MKTDRATLLHRIARLESMDGRLHLVDNSSDGMCGSATVRDSVTGREATVRWSVTGDIRSDTAAQKEAIRRLRGAT